MKKILKFSVFAIVYLFGLVLIIVCALLHFLWFFKFPPRNEFKLIHKDLIVLVKGIFKPKLIVQNEKK